jgi:hypothetical protein
MRCSRVLVSAYLFPSAPSWTPRPGSAGPAPPFSGVKGRLKPAGLSDRETRSLEAEVEAHEERIDQAVFALYGVEGLPK